VSYIRNTWSHATRVCISNAIVRESRRRRKRYPIQKKIDVEKKKEFDVERDNNPTEFVGRWADIELQGAEKYIENQFYFAKEFSSQYMCSAK